MSIFIGATRLQDLFVGANAVEKVFVGASLVWGTVYSALRGDCTAAKLVDWTVSEAGGGSAAMSSQMSDDHYMCNVVGDTTDPVWSFDMSGYCNTGEDYIIELEFQAFNDGGAGDSYNWGVGSSAFGTGLTTTFQSFLSTPGAYTTPVFTYSAATRYMKIRGILTLNSGDDFEITNFRVRKV